MLRVSLPGANIYGGIRQIMEYIPGMAAVAGIGVNFLIRRFKLNKLCVGVFLFLHLSFYSLPCGRFIQMKMYTLMNWSVDCLVQKEEIYLLGATRLGSIQECNCLDKYECRTESKISVCLRTYSQHTNVLVEARRDFILSLEKWLLTKGEYAITLTYQGTDTRSYYDMYLERFLNPVYESKVDGVSVVKVWKNSVEYLKMPLTDKVETKAKLIRMDSGIRFDLGSVQKLSRLELYYQNRQSCTNLKSGIVRVSKNGELVGIAWRLALMLGEFPI